MTQKTKKPWLCLAAALLTLPGLARNLNAQDWAITAQMGITLTPRQGVFATEYDYAWGNEVLSVEEWGVTRTTAHQAFTFGLALERALSPNIFLSLGLLGRQHTMHPENENYVRWQFAGTDEASENWRNGPVSASFRSRTLQMLLHRLFPLGLTSHLRLSAGLSLDFSHLKAESRFGFAEMAEDEHYYYFDWFRIPARIDVHTVRLMPTVGVEVLVAIDRISEIVLGAQYLWSPSSSHRWETFGPSVIQGEEGNLVLEELPDIHGDQEQMWRTPSWNLSLTAGLRFRF